MSKREGYFNGRMRASESPMKCPNELLEDPRFVYRRHIITTSAYCACRDCVKYRCNTKPIKCIDPYFVNMKYTYWIYHGLVTASKTERAIVKNIYSKTQDQRQINDVNANGN